ncbi:MAG: hypothetical protein HYZ29_09065 [Myxococcales bacterium]|nr:hypothetical protein [Myxococcales bacterium]
MQAALYTAEGDGYDLLEPGSELELWSAPQGGHWSRIGARVGGLGSDTAELVARLVDPETGAVIASASRTAPMIPTPSDSALKHPDPSDMMHVVHLPMCPSDDGRALDGVVHRLEVEVTELYGDFGTGSVVLPIVPRCQQAAGADLARCVCECGPSYAPGKCALPDGG